MDFRLCCKKAQHQWKKQYKILKEKPHGGYSFGDCEICLVQFMGLVLGLMGRWDQNSEASLT